MYPEAIVRDEAITIKNNRQSKIISKALFSGAKINMAERYCANNHPNVIPSNYRKEACNFFERYFGFTSKHEFLFKV
jgi:hypothetical protein